MLKLELYSEYFGTNIVYENNLKSNTTNNFTYNLRQNRIEKQYI